MIPNLYKIAGELTPFCFHVAARTVATHALSIFGDHSDVMACRQTGVAMLASASVQEAQDFALIGQAATLRARVPLLHFFDGFRTSHEVAKIQALDDDVLKAMLPDDLIAAHRARALTPDHPVIRGTAQNPDTFFQAREACTPFYERCPGIVQEVMDEFDVRTGRRYRLFEYHGDPAADRVVVVMGSAAETAHETVDWLRARGERVGVLKVRLYRPFSAAHLLAALPASTRAIAVLDRTKEPGALGEPLYLDVLTAVAESPETDRARPIVVGGRYGLSSKELTPAMLAGVFAELSRPSPRKHFTVGIVDDVSHSSLEWDRDLDIEPDAVSRSVFFGLGADGTVGANKNSIKIIGDATPGYAQGYFVYDSKKSGAITVSHLRFGPSPIRSAYLVRQAGFVGCHQFAFLDRYDVIDAAAPGAVLLVNSPYGPEAVWDQLNADVQAGILEKRLRLYVIDALDVARRNGMGTRINTIMQTCFFALSGVLPRDEAIVRIKDAIAHTYVKRGADVVRKNFDAVDDTLAHLHAVPLPGAVSSDRLRPPAVPAGAPDFVARVTAMMIAGKGDLLPVSAFPVDGTWPTATSQWEKRAIATEIPVWDAGLCIQCNKCAFVCPHAAIRAKVYPAPAQAGAPASFVSLPFKGKEYGDDATYTLQVAPEDCTGCSLCVQVCPARDKANPRHKALELRPQAEVVPAQRDNYAFFLGLPEVDRARVKTDVKGTQFLQPLFEYSGACAGCGETPYLKLLTQLFGDRLLLANATGCSSIYGGNLPTTPYAQDAAGRGPAWANSLFEDNAEFGLGMRLAVDRDEARARDLVRRVAPSIGATLADELLAARPTTAAEIAAQRERVDALRQALAGRGDPDARAAVPGRGRAGAEERVDRRRRRVGLRHRLRRSRPRAGARPQGQRPRPRHRGLLEHRRAAVEGDADRRRGQVRGRRQGDRQEGPRRHGARLRPRLRRAGRQRREGHADGEGLRRGRRASRTVADHRLQPVHRTRLRPGARARPAEARRRLGLLAALSLRPAARHRRRARAGPRLRRAEGRARAVHPQRDALPAGRAAGSGAGARALAAGPGRHPHPVRGPRRSGAARGQSGAGRRAGGARHRGALTWTSRPPTSDCRWRTR